MKIVFHELTFSGVVVSLVLAAYISGVAVLWLAAVPFAVGAAVVYENKGPRFFAFFWLLVAALFLATFLVEL